MATVQELFDLTGKVAIVTGGSRGLGEEMAEGLGEAGAKVVISARRAEELEKAAAELRGRGIDCHAVAGSTADPARVQALVDEAAQRFGRIDILVNNAGTSWGAPALDMTLEQWQKVIDTNVTGVFLMAQAVGRVMVEQGTGGRIINIASIAGLQAEPPELMEAIGYNTSKGADIAFTRTLAVQWARYNILVNAVAPGFFPSKMTRWILEHRRDAVLRGTPLGRTGRAGELKGVVVFLASDAASYITGQVLPVDGGATAW